MVVLRENDQSEQVYPIAVSATKASTNSVEPIKDTTKPGLEIVEPQIISKQTESAKAHLATLMADAEEKTKKAVDLGTYAAKKAQLIAFDAEAAATEAEREYRKIIDSVEKKEEIQVKIVSFSPLVITVHDAHKGAKRAAISTEAAKEAWKHVEKKAWLFKTEAFHIDGKTDTVVAAAEGANIAAKEASKALSEYRNKVEKVKAAIENVETKSHKLSLSPLVQRAMSTVKEAEKEMEQFEEAANLAKDGAADVANAWLALSDISNAQTQELEKKERKAVEMEDKEGTTQAGHSDLQQQKNKTRWTKAYMLLFSLILVSSIGTVAYAGLTNAARMQALQVLLELGNQMIRSFHRGGQPVEGQEVLIEAAGPERVIELANLTADDLYRRVEELVNIADRAAQEAVQAQNRAVAAGENAVIASENAQAAIQGLRRLVN